ncbi:MAG: hypothetical protein ABEJ93_01740 [Candidatus Nanohalobium sp.]
MGNILEGLLRDFRLRRRKGLSKPVFILAAIALAMLFVAAYYTSVSGWLTESINLFEQKSGSVGG